MIKLLFVLIVCISAAKAVIYSSYYGKVKPLTRSELWEYEKINKTQYCTVNVKLPCDPYEWKRLDGSCNNLKNPSIGTRPAGTIRVLQSRFSPNYEPAKTKSGNDYPLARRLRTGLLSSGKASDLGITQMISYYILFMLSDVSSIHDIFNYLITTTNCCTPEGRSNYTCIPNIIPADDPVHRFSGIRCMNLTRPQTFQHFGCLPKGTPFVRIQFATPVYDISQMYNYMDVSIEYTRTFENGQLKTEEENGHIFPPSTGPSDPQGLNNSKYSNPCPLNQLPTEKRCHKYIPNGEIATSVFNILFHRHHNVVAQKLKEMNPCWDDDRLFFTARDINIAISLQIFYYEMFPALFGKDNMVADGILSDTEGFRDLYDENVLPLVTDEFAYMQRYFHTMQESILKFYDSDGHFLNTFPIANCTTRTGILPIDNFINKFIQSGFRQESGKFDFTLDYDMADRILDGMQDASDVSTSDLNKGRYMGLQPYIKYREFCSNKKWTPGDLRKLMSDERIYRLAQLYEAEEDIELMAGLWAENHYPGSRVPITLYCLMTEQLKRFIVSDRHWYERPNRPHAFTLDQLKAVRNTTVAGLLCTVGDGVTNIQPNAFYTISQENPIMDCSSSRIGKINLAPWKDSECCKMD